MSMLFGQADQEHLAALGRRWIEQTEAFLRTSHPELQIGAAQLVSLSCQAVMRAGGAEGAIRSARGLAQAVAICVSSQNDASAALVSFNAMVLAHLVVIENDTKPKGTA